jgi:predicted methyltransferase
MRLVLSAIWIALFALLGQARAESADSALSAAIDGGWREPQNRARDAYRHPYESMTFWGLKPGMTVVEVDPGVRGWWTGLPHFSCWLV